MLISGIEEISKNRIKVFIDDMFAFVLYPQDMKQYHIVVGEEVSETVYEELYRDVVLRRAKQKAMNLLMRCDQTEHMIRQKLEQAYYPRKAIEDTIAFLYSYHYLDDVRFCEHYILLHSEHMGRQDMKQKLLQKGVDSSVISRCMESASIDDRQVLLRLIQKRIGNQQHFSQKEWEKMLSYFMRKGFSYHIIRECFSELGIVCDDGILS